MTLNDFKNWAQSQGSVAKYTDGKYLGECVSLINQYLARVYGIQAGAWGNAKDWATNGTVAQYFDKVGSPQAGDIGVSGATSTNPYGHIWIYLSPTQVLEQNGRVSRRVSVNAPITKPIAILRRKGQGGSNVADKTNLNTARILSAAILHRDYNAVHQGKTDGDLNTNHVNKDLTNGYIFNLFSSPEAQAGEALEQKQIAFYNKYNKLVGELEARPTKAQLEEVVAKLAAESEKVAKAEAALKEAQENASQTVSEDEAVKGFFSRLIDKLIFWSKKNEV